MRSASKPFIKGFGCFLNVALTSGEEIVVTPQHRVLSTAGQWVSIDAALSCAISLAATSADDGGSTVSSWPSEPMGYDPEFASTHPMRFRLGDSVESTTIYSAEPAGDGYVWDIEVDGHSNYLLRPDVNAAAVVNANSGKSVMIACWLSSYLRDKPITMSDGSLFYARPERFRGRSVLVWGIGINWNHIGDNMYRLLFRAGEFDIIRDAATGKWRVATKEEKESKQEGIKPSPPFIPHSEIAEDSWDWENKKAKQLHSVTFKNDESRLVFYPSTADLPSQGDKVHAIWIDENIDNPDHYTEWQMRVSDLDGQVVWSAWPTNQPNPAMNGLMERGNAQADLDDPQTLYFRFRGSDNPFSTTKTRSYVLSTMSDEESAARDTGEVDMNAWLMYPRFRPALHQALGKFSEDDDPNDKFAKALRANHGDVPHDWTRYLILDPGTVHPAVLMCAVPPPNLGDYVLAYNEVYGKRMDADQLAEKVLEETFGQVFEAFIIDGNAARQQGMGLSFTFGDNYRRAFAERKMRSRRTGSGFMVGSNEPEVRIPMLKAWMKIRPDGTTRLRIMGCPNLCKQLTECRRLADPATRLPTDKPAKKQTIDVLQCLEYAASRDIGYSRPVGIQEEDTFTKLFGGVIKELGLDKKNGRKTVNLGGGRSS